jgi:ubiquinone biosynthesis protein
LKKGLFSLEYWKRYRQIQRVLKRYGFQWAGPLSWLNPFRQKKAAPQVDGRLLGFTSPQRLRMALEELGPTFIKIGQLLSVRPELLGQEFIEELEKLQNGVPPFPFAMVQELFKKNGLEMEQIFTRLDPLPLAAASIAQVHRGILKDGREVAVKVQRVGIESIIQTDLNILHEISSVLEKRTDWASAYSLRLIVEELSQAIYRELDFTQEAKNMDMFCRNFQGNSRIIIPQVIWEYSTQNILTMEYVGGTKILDYKELKRQGVDQKQIITDLVEIMYEQVYVHGFFHADPHPGNLAIGPKQAIIFYDFGQVGDIDNILKENFVDLLVSMVRYDVDGVTRALLNIGEDTQHVSQRALRRDVARLQKKYYGVPMAQIDIAEALSEILELFTRHQIRIPSELSLLAKMLMTIESLIIQLDPQVSVVELAEPYGKRVVLQRFKPENILTDLENMVIDYSHSIKELPRDLDSLLHTLNEGEIGIVIDPKPWEKLGDKIDLSARRLSLSIILGSTIMGMALLSLGDSEVKLFGLFSLLEAGFGVAIIVIIMLFFSGFSEKENKKR